MSIEEKVIVERYVVKKAMHLGALRREMRPGMKIEWYPQTEAMKINGSRIEDGNGVCPSEAMRQLKALNDKMPDSPVIASLSEEERNEIEMKTQTLCVLPVVGCLSSAVEYVEKKGRSSEISPRTGEQAEFLQMFEDLIEEVPNIGEIESTASEDVRDVNAWLSRKGCDIRLPECGVGELSMASVFETVMTWLSDGKRSLVKGIDGNDHVGVLIKKNVTVAHEAVVHPNPVVRVRAKTGTVCMSVVDEMPEGFAGLFLKVAQLDSVKSTSHHYDGVVFPMVDLDVSPDISFMNGMEIGPDCFVGNVIQRTRFQMNEKGAMAESGAAGQLYKSVSFRTLKPCVIDRPFLLWIRRDGFEFPLFAALLCEDVWKEPKQ